MDWQNIIVAISVLVALFVIARRVWSAVALRKAGCGSGCGKCANAEEKPLVTLEVTPKRK